MVVFLVYMHLELRLLIHDPLSGWGGAILKLGMTSGLLVFIKSMSVAGGVVSVVGVILVCLSTI